MFDNLILIHFLKKFQLKPGDKKDGESLDYQFHVSIFLYYCKETKNNDLGLLKSSFLLSLSLTEDLLKSIICLSNLQVVLFAFLVVLFFCHLIVFCRTWEFDIRVRLTVMVNHKHINSSQL